MQDLGVLPYWTIADVVLLGISEACFDVLLELREGRILFAFYFSSDIVESNWALDDLIIIRQLLLRG